MKINKHSFDLPKKIYFLNDKHKIQSIYISENNVKNTNEKKKALKY